MDISSKLLLSIPMNSNGSTNKISGYKAGCYIPDAAGMFDPGDDPAMSNHTAEGKIQRAAVFDGIDDYVGFNLTHHIGAFTTLTGHQGPYHAQDIACNGEKLWVTFTTELAEYDLRTGAYVQHIILTDHNGGLVFRQGKLYVCWSDGNGLNWDNRSLVEIRVYDAYTLTLIETIDLSSVMPYGADALCHANGKWYVGDASTPAGDYPLRVYEFDEDWNYITYYDALASYDNYGFQSLAFTNGYFVGGIYNAPRYLVMDTSFNIIDRRTSPDASYGGLADFGLNRILIGQTFVDPTLYSLRYAKILAPSVYVPVNKVAFAFWCKLPYLPSEMTPSYARLINSTSLQFELFYEKSGSRMQFKFTTTEGSSPRVYVAEADLVKDDWMWVYCEYDHDKLRVYINNVQKGGDAERDDTDAIMSASFYVSHASQYFVQGDFDALMVFSDVLTAAERAYLYNSGNGVEDPAYTEMCASITNETEADCVVAIQACD